MSRTVLPCSRGQVPACFSGHGQGGGQGASRLLWAQLGAHLNQHAAWWGCSRCCPCQRCSSLPTEGDSPALMRSCRLGPAARQLSLRY